MMIMGWIIRIIRYREDIGARWVIFTKKYKSRAGNALCYT